MRRIIVSSFIAIFSCLAVSAQTDTLSTVLDEYFKHYTAPNFQPTGVCRLKDCSVDEVEKSIRINTNDVFGAQPLTPRIVNSIYASVSKSLPEKYRSYKLNIFSEERPLASLVPNPYRSSHDKSRLWNGTAYDGEPWVLNASKAYAVTRGLQNIHMAVWASHGRYYNNVNQKWEWQRPYLFSTAEDLLTQTFVVPFLIPMLENAGAVVFSPRERDWQRAEVIVDNDAPQTGGKYTERSQRNAWAQTGAAGFANPRSVYSDGENPFSMGTARMAAVTHSAAAASKVTWTPRIPADGRYAVYVSYQTLKESVNDAEYTVKHGGTSTRFKVNQRMGGGTWVYLGTFYFEAGENERNCVTLTNVSQCSSGVVTADAVRFGGGMGNIARGADTITGEPLLSRLPRYLEGSRYAMQWYGMPYNVYSSYSGTNDYSDDINARSYAANYLAGGSVFLPNADGRKVPLELSLAVHSDAGYKAGGFIGTLSLCTTTGQGGETAYPSGLSRKASFDFASMLADGVATEMAHIYNVPWSRRECFDKDYSECRRPEVPAAIIEMLSHQNFRDMVYAHDPWFKFNISRSIYKSILRYEAFEHGRKYVVQPLPPDNFAIEFTGKDEITLSWRAVKDSLEPTATPTGYILYTRMGGGDFDNGRFVKKPTATLTLKRGVVYSFKVTAVNRGGESFPTETLSACRAASESRPILIVNGFTRLSGPKVVENADSLGFDLDSDIGVAYMQTPEYSGRQLSFNPAMGGAETANGLGYSAYGLASTMVAGNTFDYPYVHGSALAQKYSFVSCSRMAVENGTVNLSKYPMVDIIFGLQKNSAYTFKNFKTFNSRLRSKINAYLSGGGALLSSGAYLTSDMHSSADRSFLNTALHCTGGGMVKGNQSISGNTATFAVTHELGKSSYAVQSMCRVRPANGAQSAFKYADGSSAGVVYQSPGYRCVTLGFPLESVSNRETLSRLMLDIAKFLMNE